MNLSEALRKIFASQKARAGESGQAVVEYILVLIVSVSIILGILYQFNDAFKNFLDSYFGDYIACLLETGELPGLGGDGPTQSECNAGFENFSIASGRPQKQTSSDGAKDPGDGAGDSDGGGDSDGSRGSGRPGSFTRSGTPQNAEIGSGAFSNNNRPDRQRFNTASNQDLDSTAAESGEGGSLGSRRRRRIIRRGGYSIGEEFISAQAKKKKKAASVTISKSKQQTRLSSLRKAKFRMTQPEFNVRGPATDMEGFNFGRMLKFLIILGIIVAIVIFLGGQALQIKKSWQKGE